MKRPGNSPPPPPRPATRKVRHRRRWHALEYLVVGLLLTLGVVDLHVLLSRDDAARQGPEDLPERAFYPPVPLKADSSYVETVVLASGDLRVTHWIYSKAPLPRIRLTAPELLGHHSRHVVATGVEVAADGRVVTGADSVGTEGRRYQVFGATAVYVTYTLTGALETSTSADGRALARVTSLDVSYASAGGTSTRSIEAADILGMACSPVADPDATPAPCGSPEQGRWQVELSGPHRDDRVMAQLNLS